MAKQPDPEALRREAQKRVEVSGKSLMVTNYFSNVGADGVPQDGLLRSLNRRRKISSTTGRAPVIDSFMGSEVAIPKTVHRPSTSRQWTYDHSLPQVRVTADMASAIAAYGNENDLKISSAVRELIQVGLDNYKETK